MPKTAQKIYQLKVTLKGSKPPIWRRFLIASSVTLPELHGALQVIMGWTDSHLHQFTAGGREFGVLDPNFGLDDVTDEKGVRLDRLLANEKDSMRYEYDFGDGWEHAILLEKALPPEPNKVLPVCINAKGGCPPEDVGGLWGYYNFLDTIKDPKHSEHEELKEWVGGDFDPDAYDIDWVNQQLVAFDRA
ncbi:MAG: plasmid pRiA4b ORF-3 family protein [Thiohalocapsa sp.]